MPKKGQKKLRGQPEIYEEVKGHIGLSITKTGVQGLDELAAEMGLSRSEFVEQIGRRLISVLSQKDKQAMKEALVQLIASSKDRLNAQSRYEDLGSEGSHISSLQEKVNQWQQLLDKLD